VDGDGEEDNDSLAAGKPKDLTLFTKQTSVVQEIDFALFIIFIVVIVLNFLLINSF
jgi:hypothetical protein